MKNKDILSHDITDTAGYKLMELEERNKEFFKSQRKKKARKDSENAKEHTDTL